MGVRPTAIAGSLGRRHDRRRLCRRHVGPRHPPPRHRACPRSQRGLAPAGGGARRQLREPVLRRLRQRHPGRRREILRAVPAGRDAGGFQRAAHPAHGDRVGPLPAAAGGADVGAAAPRRRRLDGAADAGAADGRSTTGCWSTAAPPIRCRSISARACRRGRGGRYFRRAERRAPRHPDVRGRRSWTPSW